MRWLHLRLHFCPNPLLCTAFCISLQCISAPFRRFFLVSPFIDGKMAKTKNLGWPLGRREAEPEVQRWTFNNGVKRTCWDIIQTCASYFPGQRSKYSFIIENIQFRIYKTFGSEKELIKITILRDVQKEIVNEKNSVQKTNQKSHGIAQIWRYKVALPFRNLKKNRVFSFLCMTFPTYNYLWH
jgi:hypothetical protein